MESIETDKKQPPHPNDSARPRRTGSRLRWLLRQVEHCLALIGLAAVVYFVGFHYSTVVSNSMQPTLQGTSLQDGDRVLTERFSYLLRNPRRWEVVTVRRQSDGAVVMKRVVALPGERLKIFRDGRILINGSEIRPPAKLQFLQYLPVANIYGGKVFDCRKGYYLLGDDTMDSDDSRFNGTVSREEIIGRSWLILSPGHRRGFVNP